MKTIFLLLIIYQFKHLLADYFLQGKYMLGKFKGGTAWIMPLLAHVGVHGAFTLVIASAFHCHYAPWLALLDMTLHFAMDRIKASPSMLGRFSALSKNEYPREARAAEYVGDSPDIVNRRMDAQSKLKSNKWFWICLGIDQMVHHLTHYLVIYLILVTT